MDSFMKLSVASLAFLSLPLVQAATLIPRQLNDTYDTDGTSVDSSVSNSPNCKRLPGDANWPTRKQWSQLNQTVNGRLIQTIPLGHPCHDPTYNAADCAYLKANWQTDPEVHFDDPSSVFSPIFLNQSCDPFTPETRPCRIGNYPDYVINVTSASDVAAGLSFAQTNDVRLIIKNTGHDYLGKSVGKGSLSIWTHYLKTLTLNRNYNSGTYGGYSGPAVTMGAGIQAFEAYTFASNNGLRIVGGGCPTVGLTGGYTQGGGHGLLASLYGLAADQVLEWQAVTADGKTLTATPTQNSDLYWALTGGGGGTYAIVLSMTVKAYPDAPVGGASIKFASTGLSPSEYAELITLWNAGQPALVDAGATTFTTYTPAGFDMAPLTASGANKTAVRSMLQFFIDDLNKRNITYQYNVTEFPGYLQHYANYYGPLPLGQFPNGELTGGRLVPRSVVQNNGAAVGQAFLNMISSGDFFLGVVALNVGNTTVHPPPGNNAVLPAWRNALLDVLIVSDWNYSLPFSTEEARENELTNTIVPYIENITPGSGTYLNEGDYNLATWKQDFYGSNYNQLLSIKNKYDPNHIFYAKTAVGSDYYTVASDGRLCRAS